MVHTTELATMIMMHEKYVPIKGVSEDGGCISETTFMKKVKDMRMVISKVTFSPDSGGKKKPKTAMEAMRTQGKMRVEK